MNTANKESLTPKRVFFVIYFGDLPLVSLFVFSLLFTSLCFSQLHHQKIKLTFLQTYGVPEGEITKEWRKFSSEETWAQEILDERLRIIHQEVDMEGGELFLFDSGHAFFQNNENYPYQEEMAQSRIAQMKGFPYFGVALRGRHFLFGIDALQQLGQELPAPFISSNLWDKTTQSIPSYVKPYKIKKVGSLSVGVIGVSDPHLLDGTSFAMREKMISTDPQEAVQKSLNELAEKSVDFVVLFSNIIDRQEEENLIHTFKGQLSLVISHCQREQNIEYLHYVDNIIVTKLPCTGPSLGQLDIRIDSQTKKMIDYSSRVYSPKQEKVSSGSATGIIETFASGIENLDWGSGENSGIGFNLTSLPHYFDKESPFGNFMADTLKTLLPTVDGIIINSSGFKGLSAGKITLKRLYEAIPYQNPIVTYELTGEDLQAFLWDGLHKRKTLGLLQLSGIRVEYDENTPEVPPMIEIKGQPIILSRKYLLASPEYLLLGGDGYDVLKKATSVRVVAALKKMIIQDIRERREVTAHLDGRIKIREKEIYTKGIL